MTGKSICSFAGGRLTFLKLGLTSAGFGGCVCIFVESQDSQILTFQCDREFLTYNTEFNACHDKSIRSFFDLFCVFIDGGVRVCVGPWRGLIFSVS